MNKPLVSIAMTTYNGGKFLKKQLDSIYSQTYKNIQVIVCDDCSSDNTVKILDEYKEKYGLKYYINDYNLGFIKNFEKVISLCDSEYIALADQDDIWNSDKIEILVNEIGSFSLICSDAVLVDENDNLIAGSFREYQSITIPTVENQLKQLFFSNFVTGCTCLFRKSILTEPYSFPEVISHDWWIAIIACLNGKIKYLPIQLVSYRQHSRNSIGAKSSKKIKLSTIIYKNKRKEKIMKDLFKKEAILKITETLVDKNNTEQKILFDIMKEIQNDLVVFKKSMMKKIFHYDALKIAWKYRFFWFKNHPIALSLAKFIL